MVSGQRKRKSPPSLVHPPPPQVNMALITMLVLLALAAMSRGAQQMTAEYSEGLNEQFTHISGGHGLPAALLPSMFNALHTPINEGGWASFSTLNTWKHVETGPLR
jgi:hypothetical protein